MYAENILLEFPHTTTNSTPEITLSILKNLEQVILDNIEGDIVELGCHKGLTSVYIKRLLTKTNSNKEFHCYDSFQGLPDKSKEDESNGEFNDHFVKGLFNNITSQSFIDLFKENNLDLPILHEGWFKDQNYPPKIAFAFLDGDFYQSILDSLNLIWNKVSKGGVVCIHDYGWKELPGVEKAVKKFFGNTDMVDTSVGKFGIIKK